MLAIMMVYYWLKVVVFVIVFGEVLAIVAVVEWELGNLYQMDRIILVLCFLLQI